MRPRGRTGTNGSFPRIETATLGRPKGPGRNLRSEPSSHDSRTSPPAVRRAHRPAASGACPLCRAVLRPRTASAAASHAPGRRQGQRRDLAGAELDRAHAQRGAGVRRGGVGGDRRREQHGEHVPHRSVPRHDRDRRDARQPRPGLVGHRLDHPALGAHQHLRHQARRAHPAEAGVVQDLRPITGASQRCLRKRVGRWPQRHCAGSMRPLVTSGAPSGAPRPRGRTAAARSTGRGSRPCSRRGHPARRCRAEGDLRDPEAGREQGATTRRRGRASSGPPAPRSPGRGDGALPLRRAPAQHRRAGQHVRVEDRAVRRPQRLQGQVAGDVRADPRGVPGRQQRLRLHEPDPAARAHPADGALQEDRATSV